mmetsp:Transcript_158834/g.280621  ORF Transcript_158834/g.280621 Transcript_158834/m.280621 type:complete len:163 (-) Transcript_158834:21-509(-)
MAMVIAAPSPAGLNLAGCCPVCFLPLRCNVCRYNKQHTAEMHVGAGSKEAATVKRPAGSSALPAQPAAPAGSRLDIMNCSLKEWLEEVDGGEGDLMSYLDIVCENYDRPAQVVSLYSRRDAQGVELDHMFFADCGVHDMRHQRLFRKWFSEAAPMPKAKPTI